MDGDQCVGAIVCKLDMHKKMVHRGYIAMLAVDANYRRKKIGEHTTLVFSFYEHPGLDYDLCGCPGVTLPPYNKWLRNY